MSDEALFNTQAIEAEVAKVETALNKLSRKVKDIDALKVNVVERELAKLAGSTDKSVQLMATSIRSALDKVLQIERDFANESLAITRADYNNRRQEAVDALTATAKLEREGYRHRLADLKAANMAKVSEMQATAAKLEAERKGNDAQELAADRRRIEMTKSLREAKRYSVPYSTYDTSDAGKSGVIMNAADRSKSAPKWTESDVRSLLGMPTRADMSKVATDIKGQMLEVQAAAEVEAKRYKDTLKAMAQSQDDADSRFIALRKDSLQRGKSTIIKVAKDELKQTQDGMKVVALDEAARYQNVLASMARQQDEHDARYSAMRKDSLARGKVTIIKVAKDELRQVQESMKLTAQEEAARYQQTLSSMADKQADADSRYIAMRKDSLKRGKQLIVSAAKAGLFSPEAADQQSLENAKMRASRMGMDLRTVVGDFSKFDASKYAADRGKSAPKWTEDDVRSLLGQPSREVMARASAKLKAEMTKEAADTAALSKRLASQQVADAKAAQAAQLAAYKGYNSVLDKDARFNAAGPQTQLNRAMVVNNAMSSGMGESEAVRRYGEAAVRAAVQVDKLRDAVDALNRAEGRSTQTALTAARVRDANSVIKKDAAFQQMSPDSQNRAAATAQGALALGLPQAEALKQYGSAALNAKVQSDGLGGAFKRLTVDGNDVHSMARGLASGFNLLWLTWGNLAPLFIGAGISHGFMQTAKAGMEVAHTMTIIEKLGGNTKVEMASLNEEMLRLANNGPIGVTAVAEAMKVLSLAGLKANEILSVTQDVLNFSVAGTTDIKTAADTLISVTTAFGTGSAGFSRASDVISKAAAESKSSVESFANAMKTASVIGAQYGVSLEDTATGIAALSQLGIEGTSAGTALRNMYADLSGRSGPVQKMLKQLGIEMRESSGNMRPMLEVVGELNTKLMKMDGIAQKDILQKLLSERGAKGMVELLRLINSEAKDMGKNLPNALVEIRAAIVNSYGFAAIKAAELSQTATSQFGAVKATLSASMLEAYQAMEPTLVLIFDSLKKTFSSPEFISGLTSMVTNLAQVGSSVVSLGALVTAHSGTVLLMVAAYAAVKIALAISTALMAADTLATDLNTKSKLANNVASVAGAGGLATLGRMLPGVGTAVTLVSVAWMAYDFWLNSSKNTAQAADDLYNSNIIKSLSDQADKLARLNALRITGITLTEAQARLDAEDQVKDGAKGARTTLNAAGDAVNVAMDDYNKAKNGGFLTEGLKNRRLKQLDGVVKDRIGEMQQAENAVNKAAAETQTQIDRVTAESKKKADWSADETAKRQKALEAKFGTGKLPEKVDAKGAAAAKAALKDSLGADVQLYRNADKAVIDGRKEFSDEMAQRVKLEQVTATQAIERTIDNERSIMLERLAIIDREISVHEKKKNSEKDVAEAVGRREAAERDYLSAAKKGAGEIEVINYQKAKSFREATEAADEYIKTLKTQAAREIAGVGQGERKRGFNTGLEAIEDNYAKQANAALKDYRKDDDRTGYDKALARIRKYQAAEIAIYKEKYAALDALRSRADLGANEALENYKDNAKDIYGQVNNIVSKSLTGIEDNLTSLVMTGKADFKSFAASILSDITRMIIKQQIFNALVANQGTAGIIGKIATTLIGAATGAPAAGAAPDYSFGATNGTMISSAKGNVYSAPNLSSYSGSVVDTPTYFAKGGNVMGEAGPEAIMPLSRGANGKLGVQISGGKNGMQGAGDVNINVTVDAKGTASQGNDAQSKQLGDMIGAAVRVVIVNEQRPGGMLYARA